MAIKTYLRISELQQAVTEARAEGKAIGFVPTMGALHAGHLSLIEKVQQHSQFIVVSIFVNPKQFGPQEDFSTYPRMVKSDVEALSHCGVDAVFLPTAAEIYPQGFQTYVNNMDMASKLCGQYRENHFQGVLTVVLKLFHIVIPDVAAFGKKDYQQYKLITRMAVDFHLPVKIIGGEIVREEDGLAMSSRNLKLNNQDRQTAPALYAALQAANHRFTTGERHIATLKKIFVEKLQNSALQVQYAEILSQNSLQDFASDTIDEPAVFAVAAFLGGVRLIDNIELGL